MKNMAQRGDEEWKHLQIVTHRFAYFPGQGLPENGVSTLLASSARGYNNHETDIVTTRNGIVIDHDFSPKRTTGIKGSYADLLTADVTGRPVLIRQFQNNDFAPDSTRSEDVTMSAGDMLEQFTQVVPGGTIFADCRNSDIGQFGAWISKREEHSRTLMMFYSFTIITGQQLAEEIENSDPAPGWQQLLKLVPNLYPSELITLAQRYGMPADSVADLVAVGKAYLTSFSDAGIPLFALLTMCSGITPDDVEDMHDEAVRRAVHAEIAIIEVVEWARTCPKFENLKIGSGTRSYDVSLPQPDGTREYFTYSLMTGDLVPWPTSHGLRMIKQLYATPGRAEDVLRPDFICTDEPENAHFLCCGVAANTTDGFKHSRFDAIPKKG